jgi:probable addiction module antidote protein
MSIKTKPFEFAADVNSKADIEAYLAIFLEENGEDGFIRALGHVARAKGMTEVAEKAGVSRQSLYRTLSEGGNPNFVTVNRVLKALGCQLSVTAA